MIRNDSNMESKAAWRMDTPQPRRVFKEEGYLAMGSKKGMAGRRPGSPRNQQDDGQDRRPEIKGCVQDTRGAVRYEVMEVRSGGALVWSEREHPALEETASGGFGWVEPLYHSNDELPDSSSVRRLVEDRLRSGMPAAA